MRIPWPSLPRLRRLHTGDLPRDAQQPVSTLGKVPIVFYIVGHRQAVLLAACELALERLKTVEDRLALRSENEVASSPDIRGCYA